MNKTLRRSLYGLGGLVVLLQGFHTLENARGSHAWKAWRKAREAAGDPSDPLALVPAPIPDAENFAAAPRVAAAIAGKQPLLTLPQGWPESAAGDWRQGRRVDLEAFRPAFPQGDLEKGLAGYQTELEELAQAARRPHCRLQPTYVNPGAADFPNLLGFRAAARVLQLRALVALHAGHNDAAFQDIATLLRMVEHLRQEPLLLCQLLRMAVAGIALQPIWEGLQGHAWTQPQLLELQGALTRSDFLGSIQRAWREERALHAPFSNRLASLAAWSWANPSSQAVWDAPEHPGHGVRTWMRNLVVPRGWRLQNAVAGERAILELVSDPLDPSQGRIDPRRQDTAMEAHARPGHSPYTFMVPAVGQAFAQQNLRAARSQVAFDQARTACALELHRRSRGDYPQQVADLGGTPDHDPIDGQPLRYRRTEDGGYLLYSIGWNGRDDGGQIGQGKDPLREGDWVWSMAGGHRN